MVEHQFVELRDMGSSPIFWGKKIKKKKRENKIIKDKEISNMSLILALSECYWYT